MRKENVRIWAQNFMLQLEGGKVEGHDELTLRIEIKYAS